MNLFVMADLPALKEQIKSLPISNPVIGARLGSAISHCAASINRSIFFRQYGGLRAFVSNYLPELFEYSGSTGQDDLYKVRYANSTNSPQGINVDTSQLVEATGNTKGFWNAYANPSANAHLVLSKNQTLYYSLSETAPNPRYTTIPRLNKADYLSWAKEYAALHMTRSDEVEVPIILNNADPSNYYPTWSELLRKNPDRVHARKWEFFRVAKCAQRLHEALSNAGVPDARANAYVEVLRQSQAQVRRPSPDENIPSSKKADDSSVPVANTSLNATTADVINTESRSSISGDKETEMLRAIVHRAIDEMHAEQLSSLSLPVGLTIRLFSQRLGESPKQSQ